MDFYSYRDLSSDEESIVEDRMDPVMMLVLGVMIMRY